MPTRPEFEEWHEKPILVLYVIIFPLILVCHWVTSFVTLHFMRSMVTFQLHRILSRLQVEYAKRRVRASGSEERIWANCSEDVRDLMMLIAPKGYLRAAAAILITLVLALMAFWLPVSARLFAEIVDIVPPADLLHFTAFALGLLVLFPIVLTWPQVRWALGEDDPPVAMIQANVAESGAELFDALEAEYPQLRLPSGFGLIAFALYIVIGGLIPWALATFA